jgi:inosose dehydratase
VIHVPESHGNPSGLRFGVDLITFYHPRFWDLDSREEFADRAGKDPSWFWSKLLDAVGEAGIQDLELTFAPGDHTSAETAFGGPIEFRKELESRGMGVVSEYFGELEYCPDPLDPAEQAKVVEAASRYAESLAAMDAEFLVVGMPLRKSRNERPASFVDLEYAKPLADLVNQIGAATQDHGIQSALHTESHSVFWTPRDVDLFMMLTDPMYVAMCPDTGHIALAGADPVHLMSRHRERLVIGHWKDAIGPVPLGLPIDEGIFERQAAYFTRVGTGVVDWFGWSRLLQEIQYRGCTLLELDAVEDPVREMTLARQFIETSVARFYASWPVRGSEGGRR